MGSAVSSGTSATSRHFTMSRYLVFLVAVVAMAAAASALPVQDADYNDVQTDDMEFALQEYLEQLLSQRPDVEEELERAMEEYIEQNVPEDKKHILRKRSPTIKATLIDATKKKTCFLTLGLLCVQLVG